jgi:hypothetical protein
MMNKIVALLEKHVQWIALGLGALYLGFMIWTYLVQTPISVTGIGPTPLTPGEVDTYIREHAVAPLQTAMKNTVVPEMPVPNFLDRFKSDMDLAGSPDYPLTMVWDSQVLAVQLTNTPKNIIPQDAPIPSLPALPPAKVTAYSSGKSNIQLAVAGANGANPGAVAAGPGPELPPPPTALPAVAQPAPAGGGANGILPVDAGPAAGTKDASWVTAGFTIPHADLAKAFKAVNIPAWTEHTTILQVQLYREESLPGGKWTDPQLIPPSNASVLLALPPNNPQAQPDQQNFLTWAIAHVVDILQPPFYQVNRGDAWFAPGQVVQQVAPTLPPLDPSQTYPPSVLAQYPDDQRLAYFRAHNKLNSNQTPQHRPNNGGGGPGGPGGLPPWMQGGGGGPGGIPGGARGPGARNDAPDSTTEILADNFTPPGGPSQGGLPPWATGGQRFAPPGAEPGMPPGMPQGMPMQPNPNLAPGGPGDLSTLFPIPTGDFDPNALTNDITGWAHDTSVVPGHTYRYMIKYAIKNPIWQTNAGKNNPTLRTIFQINSPDGVWGDPVNVASTTNFFVYANSRQGALTARFKVFKWENGSERSHTFEVAPGDLIGGQDQGVDYATGWTVVDLRFDDPKNPESMTVLVMDPNGNISRRDYRTDQAKKEYQDLNAQVTAASVAATPGGPAAGPGGPTQ